MSKKTIEKQVRYERQIDISEPDRDKMWVSFVPKPEQILHYGEPITVIQRLKKI